MKKTNTDILLEKYKWLTISNSIEDYVAPDYYKKLLKEYSFGGYSDIEYLKSYIEKIGASKILEIGCGSGRATEVILNKFKSADITLVDLSKRMISFSMERFAGRGIKFMIQDAIDFMKDTDEEYDLVYSLWSFSHSTHQHVHELGFEKASNLIRNTLTKFIKNNIKKGGKFFLIHFDSMSNEQEILMHQWKRVFKEFSDLDQQSPSKRILDSVLWDLDNKNDITLSVDHLVGDKILYSSENEALEIFLNFHLETYFNKTEILPMVINDIKEAISLYKQTDGSYLIEPGCYIYRFQKR